MTQNRQSQGSDAPGQKPGRNILLQQSRPNSPEEPVDNWLKDQLQQVYDDVVLEPVPQDFMDILKKIDQKNQ